MARTAAPKPPVGPFSPASLPDAAFDVDVIAKRFGVTREVAAALRFNDADRPPNPRSSHQGVRRC